MQTKILSITLLLVGLATDCNQDTRLTELAKESNRQQAEQNREMAKLNREVAKGSEPWSSRAGNAAGGPNFGVNRSPLALLIPTILRATTQPSFMRSAGAGCALRQGGVNGTLQTEAN
jgi:hypothetical protein